jgi:hypothetical protein
MATESALAFGFAPLVPMALFWVLAFLLALAAGYALYKRAPGAVWRALAFLLVLIALANPTSVREDRQARPDKLLVVKDDSPSQKIGNRDQTTLKALADLQDALKDEQGLDVETVDVSGSHGESDGTALYGALKDGLSHIESDELAGVVVVTDGEVHDAPPDVAKWAVDAGLKAPVHVLLTGKHGEGDRRLVLDEAPSYGIVGTPLRIRYHVEDTAAGPTGGQAHVTLSENGKPVAEGTVPIGETVTSAIVVERPGPTALTIDVDAGPEELSLRNNRAGLVITGVRDRLRVLLISGIPHQGERVWRNLLKSDPAVDLIHFTILRSPESQDFTPLNELALIAFPTRELFEERLGDFDLVIFDQYRQQGLLPPQYLANIADYVRRGGALLVAVGPNYATPSSLYNSELSQILPAAPTGMVDDGPFRPAITDLGQRHPVTAPLFDMTGEGAVNAPKDWGRWFEVVGSQIRHGTVVMASAKKEPLLVLDRVGDGRVAQLLSNQIWLWARGYEGGGPYAELLRRLAHWLMKEPELEEEALRAVDRSGDLAISRVSLGDLPKSVSVTTPAGQTLDLPLTETSPGHASARISGAEPGLYSISDGKLETMGAVGSPNPKEFANLVTTDRVLGPLATATGGGVTWLGEEKFPGIRRVRPGRATSGRGWIGLIANEAFSVSKLETQALLSPWILLTLAVGALAMAWYREGR